VLKLFIVLVIITSQITGRLWQHLIWTACERTEEMEFGFWLVGDKPLYQILNAELSTICEFINPGYIHPAVKRAERDARHST